MSRGGVPGGDAVVLDVAQLEALLTRTFSIGLDVGRGREKVALVRLRLSKALLGAAETGVDLHRNENPRLAAVWRGQAGAVEPR
jgi:hypothetical protein